MPSSAPSAVGEILLATASRLKSDSQVAKSPPQAGAALAWPAIRSEAERQTMIARSCMAGRSQNSRIGQGEPNVPARKNLLGNSGQNKAGAGLDQAAPRQHVCLSG